MNHDAATPVQLKSANYYATVKISSLVEAGIADEYYNKSPYKKRIGLKTMMEEALQLVRVELERSLWTHPARRLAELNGDIL